MQLSGYYQHPARAAREAASLTLGDRHLQLEHSGQQRVEMLNTVRVSDALGTIPLTLTFADGGRFVPRDDALFRQWWQQRQRPGLVHRLERHRRGVALTLLATLATIALYSWIILPAASRALANHMPVYIEQRIGQQTLMLLRHEGFSDAALRPEQRKHVEALFSRVIPKNLRQERMSLRLRILHSDGGANAFMLADGTLVVSDDLVRMARSDDAIAAVMLHEIGHHVYRHPMRMLVRSSLVSLSYMWLTGDVSGIGDTLLQSAAFMHEMQFSRDMEREADAYAVAQMKAQGRSLTAMAEMYEQLQQAGEKESNALHLPGWMSTHPDMPERIRAINAAK